MSPELIKELIADTKLPDIPDRYRAIVEIVGVENYIRLSDYAKGDELYFPKVESILAPARNRRIRKEYNGYNAKELAARFKGDEIMDRDTKCEVIKAVAAGMSDEDIANFADMELDELEAFKQENAQEITARRKEWGEFGS